MGEEGKLIVRKTKKGKTIVEVAIQGKQPMAVPFVPAEEKYNGKPCEVERNDRGQIVAVSVEGNRFEKQQVQQNRPRQHGGPGVQQQHHDAGWSIDKTKLPSDTRNIVRQLRQEEIDNFSLLWQKAVQFETQNGKEKAIFFKTDKKKNTTLNVLQDYSKSKIPLDELKNRNQKNVKTLKEKGYSFCSSLSLKTSWRMVVGLGGASVYETSMTLHHIYGIPYIPGSAVKGVIRSYLVREWLGEKFSDEDLQVLDNLIEVPEWKEFLKDPKDEKIKVLKVTREKKHETFPSEKLLTAITTLSDDVCILRSLFGNQKQKGKVWFMDAYPQSRPKLKPDVMNPHYGKYYQGDMAPADYLDPNPIFFLTVENTRFQFHFLSRCFDLEKTSYNNKTLKDWFCEALKEQGLGAKTAVGYGYLEQCS